MELKLTTGVNEGEGSQESEEQIVKYHKGESTGNEVKSVAIQRGAGMLMVNGAIMNERHEPVNSPWLVEIPPRRL